MQRPLDPTATDPDVTELLDTLPSAVARRRVVAATDVGIAPDADNRDARVAELPPPARRRVARQFRFTGHQTVFYRRVPGLDAVAVTDATDGGGFGGDVQTTVRTGSRVDAVCTVPESGTQAQLGASRADRVTTVATAREGDTLAVRAPDADTAAATLRTLTDALGLDDWTRAGFDTTAFRDSFDDRAVAGYSRVVFDRDTADADRVVVHAGGTQSDSADTGESSAVADVFDDRVTRTLLDSDAVTLRAAAARLTVETPLDESLPVTVSFDDDAVRFDRFAPEATRETVDAHLRASL